MSIRTRVSNSWWSNNPPTHTGNYVVSLDTEEAPFPSYLVELSSRESEHNVPDAWRCFVYRFFFCYLLNRIPASFPWSPFKRSFPRSRIEYVVRKRKKAGGGWSLSEEPRVSIHSPPANWTRREIVVTLCTHLYCVRSETDNFVYRRGISSFLFFLLFFLISNI